MPLSPSMRLASCPHVSPPRQVWGFPGLSILSILSLGVWVILFFCYCSWRRLRMWRAGDSIQCMFSGASGVTRVQWQELLTGSGLPSSLWPQSISWGFVVLFLSLQSVNRVGQNKTKQYSSSQTKTYLRGKQYNNNDPSFRASCGHLTGSILPTGTPLSLVSVHSPQITLYFCGPRMCLWHVSWKKLSASSICTSSLWVKR